MKNKIEDIKMYLGCIMDELSAFQDSVKFYHPDCPEDCKLGTSEDYGRAVRRLEIRFDVAKEILDFIEKEIEK